MTMQQSNSPANVRWATSTDVPQILAFIRGLAQYEKLTHQVAADEKSLHDTLFGPHVFAEVLIGELDCQPAGFALFFHNYSTFLARPGIYLEDLYVVPEARRRGVASKLLARLAQIAIERKCGRLEWAVLDWNEPAIQFYQRLGASILPDWRVCRMTGDSIELLARSQPPAKKA